MKFERYALPFFLSFGIHLIVFAASPGDLFHRREDGSGVQAIRLQIVERGKVALVEMEGSDFDGNDEASGFFDPSPEKGPTTIGSKRGKEEEAVSVTRDDNPMMMAETGAQPLSAPVKGEQQGDGLKKAGARTMRDEVPELHRRVDMHPPEEEMTSSPGKIERQEEEGHRFEETPPATGTGHRFGHKVEGREKDGRGTFSPPAIDFVPEPVYPSYSRKHGEEGVVMIVVDIDRMGRGSKIEVLRSSGYRRLDMSAVTAIGRARFLPAKRGGVPVPSRKKLAVRFFLKDVD